MFQNVLVKICHKTIWQLVLYLHSKSSSKCLCLLLAWYCEYNWSDAEKTLSRPIHQSPFEFNLTQAVTDYNCPEARRGPSQSLDCGNSYVTTNPPLGAAAPFRGNYTFFLSLFHPLCCCTTLLFPATHILSHTHTSIHTHTHTRKHTFTFRKYHSLFIVLTL